MIFRSCFVSFLIFVAAAGLYGGAYLAIVRPSRWSMEMFEVTHPDYRFEHALVTSFFRPALWLDKRFRPKFWQATVWDTKTGRRVPFDSKLYSP